MESDISSTTRLVLMVLGSYMNEVGESCFPSIETLSDKTRLSSRSVITHLELAENAGFITRQKHGFKGQKWARNEYKATFPNADVSSKVVNDVHHLNAENLHKGSEPDDIKVVNYVHTNYPYNYPVVFDSIEPKTTPLEQAPIAEIKPMMAEGALACRLIPMGVSVTSMHPTLCQWVKDKIPIELIEQCLALARLQKPLPQKIAANYLDSIIRSELRPKKPDKSWMMSDASIDAKARELKVNCPRNIENYRDFAKYLEKVIHERQAKAA